MKNPGIVAMQNLMVSQCAKKLREKPEVEDKLRETFTQILNDGNVPAREIERLWAEIKTKAGKD